MATQKAILREMHHGQVLERRQQWQAAKSSYLWCYQRNVEDTNLVGFLYHHLGKICFQLEQFEEAFEWHTLHRENAALQGKRQIEELALFHIGSCHVAMGQYEEV